jgi:hypothetical protein
MEEEDLLFPLFLPWDARQSSCSLHPPPSDIFSDIRRQPRRMSATLYRLSALPSLSPQPARHPARRPPPGRLRRRLRLPRLRLRLVGSRNGAEPRKEKRKERRGRREEEDATLVIASRLLLRRLPRHVVVVLPVAPSTLQAHLPHPRDLTKRFSLSISLLFLSFSPLFSLSPSLSPHLALLFFLSHFLSCLFSLSFSLVFSLSLSHLLSLCFFSLLSLCRCLSSLMSHGGR